MPQKGSYEHRAQSLEDRRGEVVAPFVGPESRLQSKRFACSFEHLSKCWSTSTQKVHVNTYIGGLYQATLVGMDMPPIHPPIHPPPSTYPSTYPSIYLPTLPTYLPTCYHYYTVGDVGMGHGGQAWDMGGRPRSRPAITRIATIATVATPNPIPDPRERVPYREVSP